MIRLDYRKYYKTTSDGRLVMVDIRGFLRHPRVQERLRAIERLRVLATPPAPSQEVK